MHYGSIEFNTLSQRENPMQMSVAVLHMRAYHTIEVVIRAFRLCEHTNEGRSLLDGMCENVV